MNKIAKNFLSVGFANLISQLLLFIVVAYYARILGKADFGLISLAQSILVYFTMITLFGFQTYGTREISKDRSNTQTLVSDIVVLRIIIAFLGFIVIAVIAIFAHKGLKFTYIMLIYGVTLLPLAFNIDYVFSGLQEMQHNAVYNIVKNLIPFVFIMFLFKQKNDIYYIPVLTVAGLAAAALYQSYVYKHIKKLKYNLFKHSRHLKIYIITAAPFLISSLLSMINCNIDSIIIGFLRSDEELGIYSSAYKIIFFLMNIIAVVFTPIFPVMIEYYNNSINRLNKLIKYTCKIVIMIAVPLCVGGILLSKEIIVLLFTKEYIQAYIPLSILMIYILLLFIRETYGYGLNSWNMEKQYLKSVSVSAVVNLILNLIFIPMYGINAAAVTTVVAEIVNLCIMHKYASNVVETNYLVNIKKIIIPTLILSFTINFMKILNLPVLIIIFTAIVVYFAAVIIFKYITIDELKNILVRKKEI